MGIFKKIVSIALPIILVILTVATGIYSWNVNSSSFFQINVAQCLTILVAIIVSYLLVQLQTNNKRKRDAFSRLLIAIKDLTESKESYIVSSDTISLTMNKRILSNYILLLEKNGKKYCKATDIEFIKSAYNEYDDFIGTHIHDLNALKNYSMDIKRPLDNINCRIYEMLIAI